MTTDLNAPSENLEKLTSNLTRLEELTQRLIQAVAQKRSPNPAVEAPGASLFAHAVTAYWKEAMENPGKLIEQQATLWGKTLKHYIDVQHALTSGKFVAPEDRTPEDRRFSKSALEVPSLFQFRQAAVFPQCRGDGDGAVGYRRSGAA